MSHLSINKTKCLSCKRKISLTCSCKFCKNIFCFSCLQPEIHNCTELNTMKHVFLESLNEKLQKEKCVSTKVQKI